MSNWANQLTNSQAVHFGVCRERVDIWEYLTIPDQNLVDFAEARRSRQSVKQEEKVFDPMMETKHSSLKDPRHDVLPGYSQAAPALPNPANRGKSIRTRIAIRKRRNDYGENRFFNH